MAIGSVLVTPEENEKYGSEIEEKTGEEATVVTGSAGSPVVSKRKRSSSGSKTPTTPPTKSVQDAIQEQEQRQTNSGLSQQQQYVASQQGAYQGTFTRNPPPETPPQWSVTTTQDLPPKPLGKPNVVVTPPTKTEQANQLRTLRQSQTPIERIRDVYDAGAGTYGINIRGAIRVGLEIPQIITEKVVGVERINTFTNKLPVIETSRIENTALFIGFSPFLTTSAQIQKELISQKTEFIGVRQSGDAKNIRTEAVFETTKGDASKIGIIRTNTVVSGSGDKYSFVSAGQGGTVRTGLRFPDLKVIREVIKPYGVGEFGTVRNVDGLLFQKSVGGYGTVGGQSGTFFKSFSLGKAGVGGSSSAGVTVTKSSENYFIGTIRDVSSVPSFTFTASSGSGGGFTGTLTQVSAKQVAYTSTLSQASGIISLSSTPILPVGTSTVALLPPPPKEVTTQKIIPTTQQPRTTIKTEQTQIQSGLLNQVSRTRSIQTQAVITREAQLPVVTTRTIQSQQPTQRQEILYTPSIRQINLLRNQTSRSISNSTPTRDFRSPIPPLQKIRYKTPKATGSPIKLYVKEKGVFRFRGLFSTVKEATAGGINITGKTINRSFKIVGANAGVPVGYRRSRKKGQGNVFVELPSTALSQLGEQFTIQSARRLKGGKKRK